MKQAHSRGFVHFSPARGASQHPCHSSGYLTRVLRTAATAGVLLSLSSLAPPPSLAGETGPGQPSTVVQKPTPPVVEFAGGQLSVTAKDADVRALMEAIAAKSGVEIVLDKAITGTVSAEFKGMNFEEGLKAILKDVVEGGFSSEYVKKTGQKGQLELRKVTIVRLSEKDLQAKDAIRVTDVTVQDAVGKEVVFVKWGTGKDEIEPKSIEIFGKTYRQGFARLRVDDQGNIYFIGWAHQKVFVFDPQGSPRKTIQFALEGSNFDVDHEGNVYIFDPNQYGSRNTGKVLVYGPEGNLLRSLVILPQEALFTPQAVIDDGVMRDPTQQGVVYDFRRFLRRPETHSDRRKILPYATFSLRSRGPYLDDVNEGLLYVGRGRPGSRQSELWLRFPSGWQLDRDGLKALAFRDQRLYLLASIPSGSPLPFYSNYAIGVIDIGRGLASYYRIGEKDTYIHEYGDLRGNYERCDVDRAGNVYQLVTSREGVHVYRYDLGGEQ